MGAWHPFYFQFACVFHVDDRKRYLYGAFIHCVRLQADGTLCSHNYSVPPCMSPLTLTVDWRVSFGSDLVVVCWVCHVCARGVSGLNIGILPHRTSVWASVSRVGLHDNYGAAPRIFVWCIWLYSLSYSSISGMCYFCWFTFLQEPCIYLST